VSEFKTEFLRSAMASLDKVRESLNDPSMEKIPRLLSLLNGFVHNLTVNIDNPPGGSLNIELLHNRVSQIAGLCAFMSECISGETPIASTVVPVRESFVDLDEQGASIQLKSEFAHIPTQANPTDVGYDLYVSEPTIVETGQVAYIPTGLIVKPPAGYHFEIRLRSSAPKKYGFLMPHGSGLIDPSYCGPKDELFVQVYKFGPGKEDKVDGQVLLEIGERIAQLVLVKTNHVCWIDDTDSQSVETSTRGGFGSTGSK